MKTIVYCTGLILLLITISCKKDFVVVNIDGKTLTVNAPANNLETTANSVTFWWEPLDGAEKYTLQVVQPSFSKIAQLVLDTNISTTKFNYSLKPGNYQWRLKATNAGHSTAFQTFNLKIDTTSDLSNQLVNLLSPSNGAVTGNTLVKFVWSPITAAKKYRLQINNGLILDTTLTAKTSLTYSLLAAKTTTTAFTWNVKAINDAGESPFNASSFTLSIDLKGPATPVLILPVNYAIITNADSLKWTHPIDVSYDSVYVADDSLFINLIQVSSDAVNVPISTFNLTPPPQGTLFWWKIRSFDAYGNPSPYCTMRRFKLVP